MSDRWEEGFRYLKEFADHEAHSRVPNRYVTLDGYQLGQWVQTQRKTKEGMTTERQLRLEGLPRWSWDFRAENWEDGFNCLKEFANREGHGRVPDQYKTADGYQLGVWVRTQRESKFNLSPDRIGRLEALPRWSWDAMLDKWEEGFRHLKEFIDLKGHAKINAEHITAEGYRLGGWISKQRAGKSNLSPERKARLDALPSWRWDALTDKWEEGFRYFKEFSDREGHTKVPNRFVTVDGYRLGNWVAKQQANKDDMLPERKVRLETLTGWSWDVFAAQWEDGFSYLKEFANQEGHTKVPNRFVTVDGYRLGNWVANQRSNKSDMKPERRVRLEALPGWAWDALSGKWEEGFRNLKKFTERDGHAKVPSDYKTSDGYRVGSWVSVQRKTKDSMQPERRARLEALPGWSWKIR